ncbi:hypothetical protein [Nocardia farcinica]
MRSPWGSTELTAVMTKNSAPKPTSQEAASSLPTTASLPVAVRCARMETTLVTISAATRPVMSRMLGTAAGRRRTGSLPCERA